VSAGFLKGVTFGKIAVLLEKKAMGRPAQKDPFRRGVKRWRSDAVGRKKKRKEGVRNGSQGGDTMETPKLVSLSTRRALVG